MANNIKFSYSLSDSAPVAYRLNDGFANVVSGLATGMDGHATGGAWYMRHITQQEIENSYRTSWASKKAHGIIPSDIVRPWRVWKAKADQITLIEREERRLGLRQKVKKALLFSRMYGGAAIMLGVNGDDPKEPLDVTKVRKAGLQYVHVLTRHELTVTGINMDPGSPQYGEPLAYLVNGGGRQTLVHPTRVVRFVHGELPDQLAFGQQSWGDPLLFSLRDALVNSDTAQGAFAALSVKARTSTLKIPNLTGVASTSAGEQQLIARTQVAKRFESMFHINLISAPSRTGETGEEWQNETFSFANIPEMGTWFVQMVAGACDIPLTRFAGMSPAGMNSTGDGDLRNYYQTLDAGRELDLRPRLEMIDEVLIRSALGDRPEAIWFEFGAFEVDTETTRATNAKLRAEAVKTLAESGAVPETVLTAATKGLLIDSGEYPGIEDAYNEYEKAGEVDDLPETQNPANDNTLSATIEGLAAQGKSASVAARDAKVMLADAEPMSLYVSRYAKNFAEIRKHFEDQGVTVSVSDESAHSTIMYSRQPVDWFSIPPDDWRDPELKIPEGGARMMDVFGTTLVFLFASSQLSYRHEEMMRAGCSFDHPHYQPHISLNGNFDGDLSAIKPYLGEIVFGPERFEQIDEGYKTE